MGLSKNRAYLKGNVYSDIDDKIMDYRGQSILFGPVLELYNKCCYPSYWQLRTGIS